MSLKFTILGSGSSGGVPRIGNDWGVCDPLNPKNRRTRCALLVEKFQTGAPRPTRVMIDTSPDMREQMLRANVAELDAVDGTPVVDIKPAMREFLPREPVRQPEWAGDLMREYWRTPLKERS